MPTPPGVDNTWRDEEMSCDAELYVTDALGHEATGECDFVGEVEVCIGDGLKTWTCPQCLTDHEESWSREDDFDPDYGRGE